MEAIEKYVIGKITCFSPTVIEFRDEKNTFTSRSRAKILIHSLHPNTLRGANNCVTHNNGTANNYNEERFYFIGNKIRDL